MEAAATLALATGRFTEAARLARGASKVLNDMGHPAAIGALAVILTQLALHVGLDRTGLAEVFDLAPAHVLPEAVDTTRGTATIFPALTVTLIRLHQGDRAGAEAAYALAGPVRSWTPMAAMRMAAWGHGLAAAIGLRGRRTSTSSWPSSSRSAASTPRTARFPGSTWGRWNSSSAGGRGAGAPGRRGRGSAERRPRSATPTAPAGTPSKRASSWPTR